MAVAVLGWLFLKARRSLQREPEEAPVSRPEAKPDAVADLLDRAPEDDEPLMPEEEAALEQGRREYEAGETVPLDQVKRELA